MKTYLRKFNDDGIEKFRELLVLIRNNELVEIPESLLTDPLYCELVSSEIEIERVNFLTKKKFILHLSEIVKKLNHPSYLYNNGLWTWLAAFYFDSICPENKSGTRVIKKDDSKYILSTEEWNKYYRHLLASFTRLHLELGDLSKIYLVGTPEIFPDLFEQLASRLEIASSRGVIEAVTILYWDNLKERIKTGAANKQGPGVLRRFAKSTIPQFQMTYDLHSMSGNDIIRLLPAEYEIWKS
jgi:hypothetical protein